MRIDHLSVKVWGEFALFTRPELKVERMSYPVMTPSAARGMMDAILRKLQMGWHVRRTTALRPSNDPTMWRRIDHNRSLVPRDQ